MIGQIPNFLTSVSQRVKENLRIPTVFGRDHKSRRYQ